MHSYFHHSFCNTKRHLRKLHSCKIVRYNLRGNPVNKGMKLALVLAYFQEVKCADARTILKVQTFSLLAPTQSEREEREYGEQPR